jgi:hypothetical protein
MARHAADVSSTASPALVSPRGTVSCCTLHSTTQAMLCNDWLPASHHPCPCPASRCSRARCQAFDASRVALSPAGCFLVTQHPVLRRYTARRLRAGRAGHMNVCGPACQANARMMRSILRTSDCHFAKLAPRQVLPVPPRLTPASGVPISNHDAACYDRARRCHS